jgi:hypothetical protein
MMRLCYWLERAGHTAASRATSDQLSLQYRPWACSAYTIGHDLFVQVPFAHPCLSLHRGLTEELEYKFARLSPLSSAGETI